MTIRTLLLTPWMAPHRVVSWQRGIVLLYLGKAEIIEQYPERITSPSVTYGAPSVLRLVKATRNPKRRVRFSRENVFLRDRHTCQYCGTQQPATALNYDHVLPRARGGKTTWENIATSCYPCNERKGSRTPVEAGMPLRRTPFEPRSLPSVPSLGAVKSVPPSWTHYGVVAA